MSREERFGYLTLRVTVNEHLALVQIIFKDMKVEEVTWLMRSGDNLKQMLIEARYTMDNIVSRPVPEWAKYTYFYGDMYRQ